MNDKPRPPWWRLTFFLFVMLLIEFLDEFVYSGLETARPLIRDSFQLTYTEISLITTVPLLVAIIAEPAIGLLFNPRQRRTLIIAGCLVFGAGLIIMGTSASFPLFLVGASLVAPASGVFVNLAQASLMDYAPTRRANNMALWTFSGSLAVVVGPLLFTGMLLLGTTWRPFFIGTGVCTLLVASIILRLPVNITRSEERSPDENEGSEMRVGWRENIRLVGGLLRRWAIWRWMLLLEISDFMLDVLFGLLALYMIDVVGVTQTQAGIAIAVWTGVGLLGDFLLIPLLERVHGLTYLRLSAGIILVLYPLFLLTDSYGLKLVLLGLIGLFNAGWYAILQGKLYDALGEQSGSILVVGNVTGIFTALIPLGLGLVAEQLGLTIAMWLLWISPIALFVALGRLGDKKGS